MLVVVSAGLVLSLIAGLCVLEPVLRRPPPPGGKPGLEEVRELISQTSIIIPARNEQDNIVTLLGSIASQSLSPGEIIVVDDESEDSTAMRAAREGARVITAGSRPEGWLGKPWASFVGSREAQGRALLFLDADVSLKRGALEELASTAIEHSSDWRRSLPTFSLQPYHRTRTPSEKLALLFNIHAFVGAAQRTSSFRLTMRGSCCFGPCLFCGRDEYFRVGGHAAVRNKVLEDIELGNVFRREGAALISGLGLGAVEYRMYPGGFRDLKDGFGKNILFGAFRSNVWFRLLDLFWLLGMFAAPISLIWALILESSGLAIVGGAGYLLFSAQLWLAGRRLGNFGLITALFLPVHLAAFSYVLVRSVILSTSGKGVIWKGRMVRTRD